jgi:CcmD family protein
MSFALQTSSPPLTASPPSARSTGFAAADDAISPEVQAFGAIFMVLWALLLAFLFFTRRKQRSLRAEVERLEAALEPD